MVGEVSSEPCFDPEFKSITVGPTRSGQLPIGPVVAGWNQEIMQTRNYPVIAVGLALACLTLLVWPAVWLGIGGSGPGHKDTLTSSFDVSPGGTLIIDADRGRIQVTTGSVDHLDIKVYRRVTWTSAHRAREILAAHQVKFQKTGNVVTVHAALRDTWKPWIWFSGHLHVRYVVEVPERFNLRLKTDAGGISIPDLSGSVRVRTAGGGIQMEKVKGPVSCQTAGGGIRIDSATGPMEAHTSGGTIRIGEAAASLVAVTAGGSIVVQQARGAASLHTSGGSIRVANASGSVQATTAGGSISVNFATPPPRPSNLETSGGSVRVTIPGNANLDVDARTSGGHVETSLPITVQGTTKRTALVGRLGSGGPLLRLRTSGGSIYLEKR